MDFEKKRKNIGSFCLKLVSKMKFLSLCRSHEQSHKRGSWVLGDFLKDQGLEQNMRKKNIIINFKVNPGNNSCLC